MTSAEVLNEADSPFQAARGACISLLLPHNAGYGAGLRLYVETIALRAQVRGTITQRGWRVLRFERVADVKMAAALPC